MNNYERRCKFCLCVLVEDPLKAPGQIEKDTEDWWCPECQVLIPWVSNPKMDGAFCQLHKNQDGSFSYVSMTNDPCCGAFGTPQAVDGSEQYFHNAPPARPDFIRPVFGFRNGKPVARWHFGKEAWIKLDG